MTKSIKSAKSIGNCSTTGNVVFGELVHLNLWYKGVRYISVENGDKTTLTGVNKIGAAKHKNQSG
jgi:hypothetical protein